MGGLVRVYGGGTFCLFELHGVHVADKEGLHAISCPTLTKPECGVSKQAAFGVTVWKTVRMNSRTD